MPDIDRAMRIQATVSTPGWTDILALLDGLAVDAREEVLHLISSTPDKLTGKAAVRLASRAKALEDFKETVEDELKILLPTQKGRSA